MVSPESARRLNVGMEARVLNSAPNRIGSDALDAQVREISQGPNVPPPWLSRLGLESPPRSYTVNLKLLDAKGSPLASGDLCTLRVVLSRDAPVRFLTSR